VAAADVLPSSPPISAELHFILLSPWFCKWPLRRLRHASPSPFFNYRSPSRTNFCSAEHRLLHLFREHKALFRSFLSCPLGGARALAPAKYALSVINTRQLYCFFFQQSEHRHHRFIDLHVKIDKRINRCYNTSSRAQTYFFRDLCFRTLQKMTGRRRGRKP
jgi:hypothetical protein